MSDVSSIVVSQAIQSSQSQLSTDVSISVLKKAEQMESQVVSQLLNSLPVDTYNGSGKIVSTGGGSSIDTLA
jgi:hypothetical protein